MCRISREAPTTPNPCIEAFNAANETFEQFHRSFLNIAGVNNDAELWGKAQDLFKTFETTLRSSVNDLNEEVCVKFISRTISISYSGDEININ